MCANSRSSDLGQVIFAVYFKNFLGRLALKLHGDFLDRILHGDFLDRGLHSAGVMYRILQVCNRASMQIKISLYRYIAILLYCYIAIQQYSDTAIVSGARAL